MDNKKEKIIGISLLVAAFALFAWSAFETKSKKPVASAAPVAAVATPAPAQGASAANPAQPAHTAPASAAQSATPAAVPASDPSALPVAPAPAQTIAAAPAKPAESAGAILALENDFLRLRITTIGGGIETIALLKHSDTLENRTDPANHPYLFNADGLGYSTPAPALGFRVDKGQAVPGNWSPIFTVAENIPGQRIVLRATLAQGVEVTRIYSLPPQGTDPNLVKTSTTFRNTGTTVTPALAVRLNTGTLPPVDSDAANLFLGVATYDGYTFNKTPLSDFTASSGFLGIGSHDAKAYAQPTPIPGTPWKWVSMTNQYFAAILRLTPDTAARVSNLHVSPIKTLDRTTGLPQVVTATGDLGFSIPALEPQQEVTLVAEYYVGPREYTRLAKLGQGEEKVVQFSKLYFISVDFLCKIFVVVLDGLHSLIPAGVASSWGFAIILLTIIIKALTWPLVTAQQRSAERMRKFQGPMKAIREKFKDDPKRQQQAMMDLYKTHKINPLAGCLPVLIQIPIFTGLFFTFQSLAQLRHQSFLWIPDLSMPDVIPGLETVGGFPIHILPLFMGITMLMNMRLTPMPNVEGQQKIIFYGMMIIFPVICYAMPSALMLYYSVQNVLTIFQTFHTRRRIRLEDAKEPASAAVIDVATLGKKKKR